MIKILEMFGEPISYGGQESVVYNMLSSFYPNEKLNIDLFTPYYVDNEKLIDFIESNKGKVVHLGKEFKVGDNRFELTKCVDDFFDKHDKYDVVHIHTGSLSTMLVYAKAAKKQGVKKVIVHAHIANRVISLGFLLRKILICHFLKKYVDLFIGCSKKVIETKYTKDIQDKANLIYNGIDIQKFSFNKGHRDEIRSKYNIGDKFLIGSLGRLNPQKNNYFMLEIARKLKDKSSDFRLMLVGSGEIENDLKEYVKKHDIDDVVIFAGEQKDAYKYYNAFDVFFITSYFEGLPVTAIEAQVSGLPTIISKCVTMEAKVSNRTYYLPIDNIDVWVDKILEIKENYKLYEDRANIDVDYSKCDRNITYKNVERMYTC